LPSAVTSWRRRELAVEPTGSLAKSRRVA